MVSHRIPAALVLAAALFQATPALAGWKLMPAGQAAGLPGMTVTPGLDWNRASARPGKQGEMWTRDGFALNGLEFFAAVPAGAPLYRERSRKRNPMPVFRKSLLLPELADFFERSFRVQNGLTDFTILESAPADFGGKRALRLRYRYTAPGSDLVRLGEARLTVVDGKLYAANFYAPELHYFTAGLAEAQAIMDSARF